MASDYPDVAESRRLDTDTTGNIIQRLRADLREFIEPDFGLLDELLGLEVITRPEYEEIHSGRSVYVRNDHLLDVLRTKTDVEHELFLVAMERTSQKHVTNYIRQDGDVGIEYGDERPLDQQILRHINLNTSNLIQCLDPNVGLLAMMSRDGCITELQKQELVEVSSTTDRNRKLIGILTRRSVAHLRKFAECLVENGQRHLATTVQEDGVLVTIASDLDDLSIENVRQCEQDVVMQAKDLPDKLKTQLSDVLKPFGLQIKLLVCVKGNSIHTFFYCETRDAVEFLRQLYNDRRLGLILESLFTGLIAWRQSVRLKRIFWDEDDYRNAVEYFTTGTDPKDPQKRKQSSAKTDPESLLECPICLENLDKPQSLPCFHTFCHECLALHCRDKLEGDLGSCPVCRTEFKVTSGGMPSDVLVQNLVDQTRQSVDDPCEVCVKEYADSKTVDEVAQATMYCTDCLQKLCDKCAAPHRHWKGGAHEVVALDQTLKLKLIRMRGSYCETHGNKLVEVYCYDCRTNICDTCVGTGRHRKHRCTEIAIAAEEFRTEIAEKMRRVERHIRDTEGQIERLNGEMAQFVGHVGDVETRIKLKGEELKKLVDRQVTELLQEVQTVKLHAFKSVEAAKDELRMTVLAMEGLVAYSKLVESRGKPSDVTRVGRQMALADELLSNYIRSGDYHTPYVTFCAAHGVEELSKRQPLVGHMDKTYFNVTRLMDTPSDDLPISGVTSLDDQLYVLRRTQESGAEQLEVYDVDKFALSRRLSVPDLGEAIDIVSCSTTHCLYVADWTTNRVHSITIPDSDPTGPPDVDAWPVDDQPYGLSVTPTDRNVLVTCHEARKVKEFTGRGQLVREICLQPDVVHPWQAVQVTAGQLVVSHGGPDDRVRRVCVVDQEGRVVQSYGGGRESSGGRLDVPLCLVVSEASRMIFVADAANGRVTILDQPTLGYLRDVVSRDIGKRWYACTMQLDERRQRIYVTEIERKNKARTASHVTVIEIKQASYEGKVSSSAGFE